MDNIVRINVQDYKDKILHSLHILQQTGVNCDVTLRAFNGSVGIHGIILSANNSHFVRQEQQNIEINCKKYSIQVVEAVVVFLYTGEIVIEEKCLTDLMNLCDFLNSDSVCCVDDVSNDAKWNHNISKSSTLNIDNYSTENTSLNDSCMKKPVVFQSEQSTFQSSQNIENFIPFQPMTLGNDAYDQLENVEHDTNSQTSSTSQTHLPNVDFNRSLKSKFFVTKLKKCVLNLSDLYSQDKTPEFNQSQNLIDNVEESADFVRRQLNCDVDNVHETCSEEQAKNHADLSEDEQILMPKISTTHLQKIKKQREIEESYEMNSPKKIKLELEILDETEADKNCESSSLNELAESSSPNTIKTEIETSHETEKDNDCEGLSLNESAESKKIELIIRSVKKNLPLVKEPRKKVVRGHNLSATNKTGHEVANIPKNNEESNPNLKQDGLICNIRRKQALRCMQCNVTFSSYSEQRKHLTAIHRPYPCEICNWVGSRERFFASHMYGQHKVVIYPEKYPLVECDVEGCSHKCLTTLLASHKRSHQFKHDKLICDVCAMEFTSPGGLRHHTSHHEEEDRKHKCKECGEVFGWRHELRSHKNTTHGIYKLCHKCPLKFKKDMDLVIHLHNVHGEPVPPHVKTHKCDSCDFYCFTPSYLRNHKEESHSDVLKYQCPFCNKMFKTRKNWNSHKITIHGTKRFKCDQCDYASTNKSHLTTHKNSMHSDARPHLCHLCDYSCKYKGNLNKHFKHKHKIEVVTSAVLREKMIKTGKGFDEYIKARRAGLKDPKED